MHPPMGVVAPGEKKLINNINKQVNEFGTCTLNILC